MTSISENGSTLSTVDYDLHGLAGIRLVNAAEKDVATITRQLGPIQAPLDRDPDIVIRFVDELKLSSRLRYLGVDEAAFTDDAFLVLRSKHKARARVQIPFQNIGGKCEIICERNIPAVPLLIPILNLTVLANGALPMHASAFKFGGKGILATGWAKGGKTETLLSFMAKGGTYVGDEWVYLSADGQRMYGIPEPIRIWEWHLQDMPQYWDSVKRGDRAKLRSLNLLVRSMDRTVDSGIGRGTAPVKLMQRMTPILKRQLNVQLPPRRLFGQEGVGPMMSKPEIILFVASHETDDIRVKEEDPLEIADRMVFSLLDERLDFMAYYLKFRFAFPKVKNDLIEGAEENQRKLLRKVLVGKETYSVLHPYPVSIPSLYEAVHPFLNLEIQEN
ncbi:MAG: hypothetical protein R3293_18990 [Candidatus Promineifilaceae bacterium]|nr:hypothetical protein [Candidatus Promineifilaceae bacterium]